MTKAKFMKLLQIQFTKFYHCLVGQVVTHNGMAESSEHVKLSSERFQLCDSHIILPISTQQFYPAIILKDTNIEVDSYLEKIIRWITEEQFAEGIRELRVGETCEVKNCEREQWYRRTLVAILPQKYQSPYVVERPGDEKSCNFVTYARPLGSKYVEPVVNNDLYTWKTE